MSPFWKVKCMNRDNTFWRVPSSHQILMFFSIKHRKGHLEGESVLEDISTWDVLDYNCCTFAQQGSFFLYISIAISNFKKYNKASYRRCTSTLWNEHITERPSVTSLISIFTWFCDEDDMHALWKLDPFHCETDNVAFSLTSFYNIVRGRKMNGTVHKFLQ